MNWWQRLFAPAPIKELMGNVRRYVINTVSRLRPYRASRDLYQHDYEFFDRAEAGLIPGLEVAGLLLKPIANKAAAWVLGRMPKIRLTGAEQLEQAINAWLLKN